MVLLVLSILLVLLGLWMLQRRLMLLALSCLQILLQAAHKTGLYDPWLKDKPIFIKIQIYHG